MADRLAALLLSVVIRPAGASLRAGRLDDLGAGLLHFVVQGTVKVVTFQGDAWFPLVWMAASALLPMLVFVMPQSSGEQARRRP